MGLLAAVPLLAALGAAVVASPARAGPLDTGTRAEVLVRVNTGEPLSYRDLYLAGGPLMHVIAALAILALTVGLYAAFSVRPASASPPALAARLREHLNAGDLAAATALVEGRWSLMARVVGAGIRRQGSLREGGAGAHAERLQAVRQAMESAGRREAALLRQRVGHLASIGAITPLVGLTGTILGMIQIFRGLALELPNAKLLSGGVLLALTTTAFGLIVGVLAMAAYYYVSARLTGTLADAEIVCEEQAELLARVPSKPTADRGAGGNDVSPAPDGGRP